MVGSVFPTDDVNVVGSVFPTDDVNVVGSVFPAKQCHCGWTNI